MPPKATIIISVYNRFDFLELVLAGFELQTEKNFEIIVSDDGSGVEFVSALKEHMRNSPLRIIHNWHEDKGFRKNMLLNNSITRASADYLIFVDGDCIPHPAFIKEHLKHKELNTCLVGRRVDLSNRITNMLTAKRVKNGYLQSTSLTLRMFGDYLMGGLKHFKNGLYFRNPVIRAWLNREDRGLLGANFSIHKADMLAINGFDERYNKPTFGEDSDVELRLRLSGVQFKSLIGIAVMYHCFHKLLPRPEENRMLFEQAKKESRPFTPFGILKTGQSNSSTR